LDLFVRDEVAPQNQKMDEKSGDKLLGGVFVRFVEGETGRGGRTKRRHRILTPKQFIDEGSIIAHTDRVKSTSLRSFCCN
jgi:hypothetical protein